MNHFDKDEILILSETHVQRSHEPQDSTFRRNISRTRSASISIPMASLEPYERQPNLVRTTRKTPISQMSGPLYATAATGNPFQNTMIVTENFSTFDGMDKNEHLLRSGQLGMCNDPYFTTCPTHFKVPQQRKPRASTIFDPKFHNSLYGDTKGYGRKLFSFCSSCIPGVMNPHAKVVQQWNKFLAIFCIVAIYVDPLFFFLFYVNKDNKCIRIDMPMATTLVVLRSITDVVYLLNILFQFRLAYVSPESRGAGAGDLVYHPKKIAANYFKSYLFFDVFVVLPLPQIMILIVLPNSLGSSQAIYAKNLLSLVIFVQLIAKLFRFLPWVIGRSSTRIIYESAWANLAVGLLVFLLSAHVVGSCWYLFGLERVNQCLQHACHLAKLPGCMNLIDCNSRWWNISATWSDDKGADACLNSTSGAINYGIYANAVQLTIETTVAKKYMYAVFWGFQQIITLAGNQTPSNSSWEILFTMSIMVLGLLYLAHLIGTIQTSNQSLAQRKVEMQLRGRDVEQWMSHRRLPEDLKRRVRQAEQYSWAATRGVSEKMVLENLPEDLQTDIRRHLFKFVKNIRFFSLMDEDEPILDAIRERLVQTTYIEGSIVFSQGGLIQKMVFIVRGKMESIGKDEIPVLLSEGDASGEELLTWYLEQSAKSKDGKKVKIRGHGLTSDRTVKCLTNVEAFSLDAKDIEEVTTLFSRFLRSPHVQQVIRYQSPYWRSLAANRIQVAWSNRKKRLSQANTTQNNYQTSWSFIPSISSFSFYRYSACLS
ncbi:cyclic nucleotide gated channel protein [Medicago truncatula]|uniref:Cyclic nucleotide gated channel protein n=1 Tax=Medicago truncatula TaxID=3880 RepID=A0A072UCP5_MEDTR|nr:cyclic nucleotide gated channel protein [Medicago truncatula]